MTEVIAGLPLAQRVAAEKPGLHAAAAVGATGEGSAGPQGTELDADAPAVARDVEGIVGAGDPEASSAGPDAVTAEDGNLGGDTEGTEPVAATPWIRRRRNLTMVLGATAGVGLVTAGLAWGLHTTKPISSTPIGVVPVTGQTAADQGGGLVSGGAPAAPAPAATPQFAPEEGAMPPAPAMPPPAPMPALPPDPYANDPALKAPPPAPAVPNSQARSDGLPADNLSDDLADPSQSGATGLDDPSYGPAGAPSPAQARYRSDPRRYGSSGYRDPQRSNGPLGPLNDHDNRSGPRRGPVDDAVPGLGGLGSH